MNLTKFTEKSIDLFWFIILFYEYLIEICPNSCIILVLLTIRFIIFVSFIPVAKILMDFYNQGPDIDDMLSFFPCEIEYSIQYVNLGYEAQAPKIVIL